MNKNKVLFAALASMALVGCADQEFEGVENGVQSGLNGKQVEAGLLSVGREADTDSRALNPKGNFVWMPTSLDPTTGAILENSNQRVGFCWTGRNNENPSYGAVTALGGNVYTNYEYEHVGWLDKEATSPAILECSNPAKLANGAYLVEEGLPEADFTNTFNISGRWNAYYATATTGKYDATTHEESTGELNLGRGVFKTNNASVFEGEYLVYYPYTDEFTKGEIIATLPTSYTIDTESDAFAAASDASFALGYVNHYAGGNSSSGLAAKTLNGYAIVRLYNYHASDTPANKNIKKVIIYSKTGELLYSQSLSAQKSAQVLAANGKLGTNVYGTSKSEKTNTIVANLKNSTNAYTTVAGTTTAKPAETSDTKYSYYTYVAIPMLPQTLQSNFEIVLVDDQEKTCRIDEAPVTFTSNGPVFFDYNLNGMTFKNEYMAVDEASLWDAWTKIYSDNSTTATAENAKNTILVMNDITLANLGSVNGSGSGNYNSWFYNKNVEITTECTNVPTITLAPEQLMSIKSQCAADKDYTLTFKVPFVVAGADCCEAQPAALVIGGAQDKNYDINFEAKVTNHGTLVVNNDSKQKSADMYKKVSFAELENSYDEWAEDRNKTVGAAELYLLGIDTEANIATLNNKGTVNTDATSINTEKLFTDKILPVEKHTSGIPSLTARTNVANITTLNNEGEVEINAYTLVNVNTALDNKIAGSLIKVIGDGHSTIDGRMDVKGTSKNEGVIDNTGVVNFNASSLDNNGLFIDRQSGQVGGKKVDNGTATGTTTKTYGDMIYSTDLGKAGIYVAQVETAARFAKVLSDAVVEPSTVVVEILGMDKYSYNLEAFEKTLDTKDVYVNSPSKNILFVSNKEVEGETVYTESVFGHCVTVLNGSTLNVKAGTLSTIAAVNIQQGANFNMVKETADNENVTYVTVGTNLNNNGTTNNQAALFTVNSNLNNNANATGALSKFVNATSFLVKGNVVTSGTFDSNGTPNTVKGNFTQNAGAVTFAPKSTTTIEGTFSSIAGTFEREGLNGGNDYRATVNVNTLGTLTGTTTTAWPTEY